MFVLNKLLANVEMPYKDLAAYDCCTSRLFIISLWLLVFIVNRLIHPAEGGCYEFRLLNVHMQAIFVQSKVLETIL